MSDVCFRCGRTATHVRWSRSTAHDGKYEGGRLTSCNYHYANPDGTHPGDIWSSPDWPSVTPGAEPGSAVRRDGPSPDVASAAVPGGPRAAVRASTSPLPSG